jgi:hypothetical protein
MPTPNTRKPCPDAANIGSRAKNQIQRNQFTRIAHEVVSAILAALIFASVMLTSVFGMSGMDQPEAITVMAEVDHGHR